MTIDDLRSRRIALLGWGVNHRAVAAWLLQHGVTDVSILDEWLTDINRDPSLAVREWRLGPTAFDDLSDIDLILRSPGIPFNHPKLVAARLAGVQVSSQTKLFFSLCPARIIGVTGTNGKGTTSSIIFQMIDEEGKEQQVQGKSFGRGYLAGNIGRDPFEFLDELKSNDWVILELSSFQLEDLTQSPHIAVVLAITPDHLEPTLNHPNHHGSFTDYQAAKRSIVAYQQSADVAILHADDPVSASFASATPASIHWYTRHQAVPSGVAIDSSSGVTAFELVGTTGRHPILPVSAMKLRGPHNQENMAAAMAAASAASVSVDVMARVARSFESLPNRLEDLGTVNQITFVNDSYATSPIPTIAAIRSFDTPIVLLLGGQGKGANYTDLVAEIISSPVRVVVCYGAEGERFQQLLRQAAFNRQILYERLFDDAFAMARTVADPGNVVLLSPSATSFDQFSSYTERGNRFRQLVMELTHGA